MAVVAKRGKEDTHSRRGEVNSRLSLSFETVQEIIHRQLHLRKLVAKRIPQNLTDEQKRQRVNVARDLLSRFKPDGPGRVTDVIRGDKTWVPSYGITSKRRKKAWLVPNEQRHQICKPGFQEEPGEQEEAVFNCLHSPGACSR